MKQNDTVKKLALAGVLTAVAVVGSFISFPIAWKQMCTGTAYGKCAGSSMYLDHGGESALHFAASLIRNLLGLGSLMAFPGSMVGALCCGLVYAMCRKLWLTCCWLRRLGTGVLGGIAAYPVAKLLMGLNPTGLFVYIVPFLVSTVVGSILAYVLISALEKGGALNQIRTER